jgi:hypothetical protein
LHLLNQALELGLLQTHGVLAITGFFTGNVPVGHPAELLALTALKHDQEWIERHFFLFFPEPGLELVGQMSGHYSEVAVAGPELEVEVDVEVSGSATSRTIIGKLLGEVGESIKQLLVGRVFLVALRAAIILSGHVGPPGSEETASPKLFESSVYGFYQCKRFLILLATRTCNLHFSADHTRQSR